MLMMLTLEDVQDIKDSSLCEIWIDYKFEENFKAFGKLYVEPDIFVNETRLGVEDIFIYLGGVISKMET